MTQEDKDKDAPTTMLKTDLSAGKPAACQLRRESCRGPSRAPKCISKPRKIHHDIFQTGGSTPHRRIGRSSGNGGTAQQTRPAAAAHKRSPTEVWEKKLSSGDTPLTYQRPGSISGR